MGSLIQTISALSQSQYGVNVLEQDVPASAPGASTNVVAVVGNFPWGPVDTIGEITSNAELFDTFAPLPFDALDDYPALKSFLNKTFPNTVKVVRVSPSGQAKATHTFLDGSSGNSVDVTAKYFGVLGNSIKVEWSTNADDSTARDATVSIGTAYSVTYPAVATIVSAALVVTDPGDPYVTFAKHSAATLVPAVISATALSTGADGTAAAGDYSSAIELFAGADVGFDVGFVAEPESAILDDVNDALKSFVDSHGKGMWVLSTPASQSAATSKTYVADYRSDRLVYPWPRVKTINGFDPDRAEITVDGAPFVAAAMASVQPEIGPGGKPGAAALKGITAIEQVGTTLTTLNALNAKGITPFFMSDALEGAILFNGLTTSLTAGRTKIFRRRMTDYVTTSLAGLLEHYVGEPLDINLSRQALGPITGPEAGQITQFLENLKNPGQGNPQRIRDYSLDPFGGNLQSNIDAGQWILVLLVQLLSMQEQIVLRAQIGESVAVTEA